MQDQKQGLIINRDPLNVTGGNDGAIAALFRMEALDAG